MLYSELEERVVDAWIEASCKFRFRMHPKYRLSDAGREYKTLLFLPDYGGPKGMVVAGTTPPDFAVDSDLSDAARRAGLFVSFINLNMYETFDDQTFRNALDDWKYPAKSPSESTPEKDMG